MIRKTIGFLFFMFISSQSFAQGKQVLTMCIDHYPPNHIFPSELANYHPWKDKMQEPFGYAINAMEVIAQRLNLHLETTGNTPFKRCLASLKSGSVDVMWGLLANEERKQFLHLFEYTVSSPKVFVVRRDGNLNIKKYDDLKDLSIGVVRGFKYFKQFDKEEKLFKKVKINSMKQGLDMVLAGRIDAFIIRENSMYDYFIAGSEYANKLTNANYRYEGGASVYIGLSKKSKFASRRFEFEEVVNEMRKHGVIDVIQQQFNRMYYGDVGE